MNKVAKVLALICLGVFMAGSCALAYPSKATLLNDVKALLKENNSKFTQIVPTNKWENDWSSESLKERGFPNDQCYTFVSVTYAKEPDGSQTTQKLRIIYNRSGSSDDWSYSDFYPYGSTTTGIKVPTDAELLSRVIASMKKNPNRWFMDVLLANVKGIKQLKIANPSQFEQITSDKISFNVEWVIEEASGRDYLTVKKTVAVGMKKEDDIWVIDGTVRNVDSKDISQVPSTQSQLDGMKNLERDGFDAVYGSGNGANPSGIKAIPSSKILLKAIAKVLGASESSYCKFLSVDAKQVGKISAYGVDTNQAKWDGDNLVAPFRVTYLFYSDEPDGDRQDSFMQYNLTQIYSVTFSPSGAEYVVAGSVPQGEALRGVASGYSSKQGKTAHDAFVKAGKAN